MFAVQNYTDTKCELEIAKTRLNLLIDKKNEVYCKYFPANSMLKEVIVDGGNDVNDTMADYLHELHEIDIGTGMSLADEIVYQKKKIRRFQKCLDSMDEGLGKMTGIEYQLFYEIVYNGRTVSNAVDTISQLNNKDSRTIWKYHYPKIKKYLRKILKFTKVQ